MADYWISPPSLISNQTNNKPNNTTTMEKYFVIKDVDGMCFIKKSFNDENKANCLAELLADGNDNNYIKYYVAKVIVTK